MSPRSWRPDRLDGFEQSVLKLSVGPSGLGGDPPEGPTAVLVRPIERPQTDRAVLYVHGWNDYFFQRHVAVAWGRRGYDFYALDLRRYGRSWVEGQLRGFTTDLTEYHEELDLAIQEINRDHDHVVLMGHSTGGLVVALYLHDRPHTAAGLILNSPWLDLQGGALARALGPVIKTLGGQRPTTALRLPDPEFYKKTLHTSEGGEWDYDLDWKSHAAAPVRVGWLRAVLQGHARVAAGLAIDCPVLVVCSARSDFSRKWSEALKTADVVLDVEQIANRSTRLGRIVTVVRVEGAVHDVTLSAKLVRQKVFREVNRWLTAYGPADV